MMITYTNANNEIFTISLNHHRIVKEPGFDIIIHNVDELNFYQKNKNIYMKTLYLIFDYPYKYYTFKLFEV